MVDVAGQRALAGLPEPVTQVEPVRVREARVRPEVEARHALAPQADLRFRLLPRKRDTRMEDVRVDVVGGSFETPVPVAPDGTFGLARDPKALAEDAQVRPNRKAQTMTWRTDIRTPLPLTRDGAPDLGAAPSYRDVPALQRPMAQLNQTAVQIRASRNFTTWALR